MTAPLRIVLPIFSFAPGGAERVALMLAEAWQAEGAAVQVVLGTDDGAMRADAPRLDYHSRPSRLPVARFRSLWMIWCLWRHLRRHPADVLFCPGNAYAAVGVAMRLLLRRRCPPAVLKISNDLVRRDRSAVFRWGYARWLRIQGRLLDRFVALTPPMRAEIAAATGVGADRIAVVANPSLSHGQFARLAAIPPLPPGAPPRFLAIGRLAPQKNFALLIRAFARADVPGSRLTILGEGPERLRLERLVRRLGLGDRVALPGYAADTEPHLRMASALLLSSDFEGLPAVVVEALAAGRPVVATDCCVSMADLLDRGRLGILVPPGDEAGLARGMAKIGAMPFGVAAARATAEAFTVARVAPRYHALFAALAQAGRRGVASPMQGDNKSVTVLSR